MEKENEKWQKTIHLTITDIGNGQFSFQMTGDHQRIGHPAIPVGEYTPAEFWAGTLFQVCGDYINRHGDLKQLNREERRAGKELTR